ncbi:hypothetical protein OK074_1695 [Actinobacteria bacterium OK074]|nr:hypothetical protein OK074_1695 [Actinobacteria bacterium OK074]
MISQIITEQSNPAICHAFTDAMNQYGSPSEVFPDHGKQFTRRFTKPLPAEAMFERIGEENSITTRLNRQRVRISAAQAVQRSANTTSTDPRLR